MIKRKKTVSVFLSVLMSISIISTVPAQAETFVRNDENSTIVGVKKDPLTIHTSYSDENQIQRFAALGDPGLPSKFDLRDEGRVSPVKDQGPNGSCWAFASYGSSESTLLPGELLDFSEKNMRNNHGFDYGPKDGGTRAISAAYLARWSGPISEKSDPYSPYDFNSPYNLEKQKELSEVMYIPDVRNVNDRNVLKQAIKDYGASYTTVDGSTAYTNFTTMGHYSSNGTGTHAVTIVGWDDNFSRYNFNKTAPGDGAWIVKNSWGNRWGRYSGYYYVSYYDNVIGKSNAIYIYKDNVEGKKIHNYDYLGMTDTIGYSENTGYFTNIFPANNEDRDIVEVGVFIPSNNTDYEIYVSTDASDLNNKVKVASGRFTYAGYKVVPIEKQKIKAGKSFAPIVKFTTPGYNSPIPIERPITYYSSRATASSGQSFISYDGNNWTDLTRYRANSNVCVKAFTMPSSTSTDVKVSNLALSGPTSMNIGEVASVKANIEPSNASNKSLVWASSVPTVATVENGNIKALKSGSTTISARTVDGSNITKSINIKVNEAISEDVKVNNISFNTNNFELNVLDNKTIVASVSPENASNKVLYWSSSNDAIAKVKDGVVTAVSEGSATITARSTDGSNVYSRVTVTVKKNEVDNGEVSDFVTSITPNATKITAGSTIYLNTQCSYNGYAVSYANLKCVITGPDGKEFPFESQANYYGQKSINFTTYTNMVEGTYKVKVYAERSGYGKSIGETSFEVSKYVNPYTLIADITSEKKEYTPGENPVFNVTVKNSSGYVIPNAYSKVTISGPNNFESSIVKYTDANGKFNVVLGTDVDTLTGDYSIKVETSYSGYYSSNDSYSIKLLKADEEKAELKIVDTDEGLSIINAEKNNSEFVLLDVRTKAEYQESHIENAVNIDYYSENFKDEINKLERDKKYLVYCRTQTRSTQTGNMMIEMGFKDVTVMNGGMTQWLKEAKPSVFPEYEKTLDVELTTNELTPVVGSEINFDIKVKDTSKNYIRHSLVDVEVLDSKGNVIKTESVKMNDIGEGTFKFTPANNGEYKVKAVATMNNYKSANGLCLINVGENRRNLTSFENNKSAGMYSHLNETDYEMASLKDNYGKNILKYLVKDNMLNNKQLSEIVNSKKKTVLVFGYPGCGPCVEMWKIMAKLPHSEYNFVEVVTSVEEDVKSTVDFTENILKELNIENLKSHIFYDAVDGIWGSRLNLLTTPNTLFLDENGRLINIAGFLDAAGLKSMYKKTFGEDISFGDEEVVKSYNISTTVKATSRTIDDISISGIVKADDGSVLRDATLNLVVNDGYNKYINTQVKTDYYGKFYYNIKANSLKANKYIVSVSYPNTDLEVKSSSNNFEVIFEEVKPTEKKLTYNDRYNNGEFNHNSNNDLYSKLRNAYGVNIKNYSVTNLSGQNKTIGDIIDGKRPTVIGLGYPSCGGCQGSWKSLVNIDKSKFNMIEAMTTTSTYEASTTLDRLGLGSMKPYFYVGANDILRLIGPSYVPMLLYLDKDGNITNVSYFESNNQVINIVNTVVDTLSIK